MVRAVIGAAALVAIGSGWAGRGGVIGNAFPSRSIDAVRTVRDASDAIGGASAPALAAQTGEAAPVKSSRAAMEPTLISSPAAWFGPDNYPRDAIRASRQGRVVAAIKVDARGVAVSCSIEVSSGTTSLDNATCNNALAHAAFDAATDQEGRRVEGIYHLSVRWVLPEPQVTVADVTKSDPEDTLIDYEVKIDADGRAISCTPTAVRMVTQVSPPCGQFSPGTQTQFRWKRKGHPVGARLIYHSTLHVVADQ